MNLIRRLPPFEYLAPQTVAEACAMLTKYKGKAKALAGGTDLLVQMKERKVSPDYLVGLKNIRGLDKIEVEEGVGVRIGALATHQAIASSSLIKNQFTCLAEACRKIASPQVRSIATIGGNLCNAGPSADSAPALLALGAKIRLSSRRAERLIPVEKFFLAPFRARLRANELLTAIILPFSPGGSASSYCYLTKRTAIDETLVGAAAWLTLGVDGVCQDVKIGLCSVSPTPFRALKAEKALRGKKLDAVLIEKAAGIAAGETSPRSRADYRREMSGVMVSRALDRCWQQIVEGLKGQR